MRSAHVFERACAFVRTHNAAGGDWQISGSSKELRTLAHLLASTDIASGVLHSVSRRARGIHALVMDLMILFLD